MYKKIVLNKGQKVFFCSDPHYAHKNICRGTSTWDLKEHGGHNSVRDFDTLEQMNDAIVEGINKYVGENDWLVCLGDWSFNGIQNIWDFRRKIKCRNIILVFGNHDQHIINNKVLPNVALQDGRFYNVLEGTPVLPPYAEEVRAQEIFESVHPYLELTVSDANNGNGKRTFNLFHFPIRIWNKGHKGRIHLYGHCHGGYTAPDRSMDVGIDRAYELFGEYCPFSLEDVLAYMDGREYLQLDHHNKNTN